MTYCLGWKTQTCAYLVADTATTSLRPLSALRSSFGERHVSGAKENIQEGALKIISAHGAGITFSGDSRLGYEVVKTFRMAVKAGVAPRSALQRAINSSISPSGKLDLSMLCAFMEGGDAHLISFNRDHDRCFVEHAPGDLVQLGSLAGKEGTFVCQISDAFLGGLRMELEGSSLLACALGLCQSYGIHNVLLAHGVGGAFVGAFVDVSGFHWQPDIGYLLCTRGEGTSLERGDGVFPFIRNDVLVVRSLLADGPRRIFITSLGEPDEAAMERAKEVDQQSLAALDALQLDYLVFLNTSVPIVTVVEMGRRSEHRYVVLHPPPPPSADGKGYIPISVGPPLSAFIAGVSDLVHVSRPIPESMLGAMLHYVGFQHPCFGTCILDGTWPRIISQAIS